MIYEDYFYAESPAFVSSIDKWDTLMNCPGAP